MSARLIALRPSPIALVKRAVQIARCRAMLRHQESLERDLTKRLAEQIASLTRERDVAAARASILRDEIKELENS